MTAVDLDRVVRAHLPGQRQRGLRRIDDDDLSGGHRPQALDADMAEAPGADHDRPGARAEDRDRLLDRVDRGEPGVRQSGDGLGLERWIELDDRTRAREQEVGEPAVAVDAGEGAGETVHIVARAARVAEPAGDERVHDHRVAHLDVGHRGTDRVHPAGVLVPGCVRELDPGLLRPLTLLDVQVGAA